MRNFETFFIRGIFQSQMTNSTYSMLTNMLNILPNVINFTLLFPLTMNTINDCDFKNYISVVTKLFYPQQPNHHK